MAEIMDISEETMLAAVLLPDGGMLNFVANTMAQLNQFESQINFYDPPF